MPQPSGPSSSIGTSFVTFTTLRSLATAKLEKDDCPKKWPCSVWPSWSSIALLPSGRAQPKLSSKSFSQLVGWPWTQNLHFPQDGHVIAWIDLTGILPDNQRINADSVLNGIAYDAAHNRLFVTGKQWPALFEIKVLPPAQR